MITLASAVAAAAACASRARTQASFAAACLPLPLSLPPFDARASWDSLLFIQHGGGTDLKKLIATAVRLRTPTGACMESSRRDAYQTAQLSALVPWGYCLFRARSAMIGRNAFRGAVSPSTASCARHGHLGSACMILHVPSFREKYLPSCIYERPLRYESRVLQTTTVGK